MFNIGLWSQESTEHLAFPLTYSDIRGYFYNDMRYINLRFTYLLTYMFFDCTLSNLILC